MRPAARPRRYHRDVIWLAALLAVALLASGAAAQPAAPDAQAALERLVAPLFQQLAAAKGLANPGPPPPVLVRSRDESRRFIQQELDRRYSPALLEAERKGLVAWGLIPPSYDLRRLFVDLMNEQVAAYYDPRGKVMVVGDWLSPLEQQAALLHELVHALQDREVSLDQLIQPTPGQGDQILARQALIEGEAMALMFDVILRAQGGEFARLPDVTALRTAIAAGTVGPVVQQAPRFLRELLLFPYVEGLRFVHQLRQGRPWSAVSALYQDPPRSTSQILHPEQRLGRRQDPVAIALPDLASHAGGWPVAGEDELGEFALGFVLGLALGDPEGKRTAVGWRGDHYRLWDDPQGGFAMVYVVTMADARGAAEMASALARLVEHRYPGLRGKSQGGAGAPLRTWTDGGRGFAVESRGADVLLIERLPAAGVPAAREAVWRSRP